MTELYSSFSRKPLALLVIAVFLGTVLVASPPQVSALTTFQLNSAPACIYNGFYWCFARGTDNAVWYTYYGICHITPIIFCWVSWTSLGGQFLSAPTVASYGTGSDLIVAGQGLDRNMYWNVYNGASWSGWSDAGTVGPYFPGSAPACVSYWPKGPGTECIVRGTDNNFYVNYVVGKSLPLSGASWSGWSNPHNLAGYFTSAPGAASYTFSTNPCGGTPSCDEEVFFLGPNILVGPPGTVLYQEHWDGLSGWSGAGGIPSSTEEPLVGSHPGCGSWGPGRLDCFYTTASGDIWHDWWDSPGPWKGEDLGLITKSPGLTSAPTVTSETAGHLEVFASGPDHGLWELDYTGVWGSWFPVDPVPGLGGAVDQAFNNPIQGALGFEQTANAFDNSAAGYAIAHRLGAKAVFTFSDSTRVNQATGELNFSPDYSNAVVFAGHQRTQRCSNSNFMRPKLHMPCKIVYAFQT